MNGIMIEGIQVAVSRNLGGTVKLSEAIKLGRVLAEPTPRVLIYYEKETRRPLACALGLAGLAVGETYKTMIRTGFNWDGKRVDQGYNYRFVARNWPWTTTTATKYPCGCVMEKEGEKSDSDYESNDQIGTIIHLFDHHFEPKEGIEPWSLDRIIAWVESIEDRLTRSNTAGRWRHIRWIRRFTLSRRSSINL